MGFERWAPKGGLRRVCSEVGFERCALVGGLRTVGSGSCEMVAWNEWAQAWNRGVGSGMEGRSGRALKGVGPGTE